MSFSSFFFRTLLVLTCAGPFLSCAGPPAVVGPDHPASVEAPESHPLPRTRLAPDAASKRTRDLLEQREREAGQ